jgi:hypothetical protein
MMRPTTEAKKPLYAKLSGLVSQEHKERLQKLFWIYITHNYSIRTLEDFKPITPKIRCRFVPITPQNCFRVTDFREESRVQQYREKLINGEKGFFAEHEGKMVGSIWATINAADRAVVVRKYMKLLPNEALAHDGVASDRLRGMRIGPYMVSEILTVLVRDIQVDKVVWDVHFLNRASMRMLDKLGVKRECRVVSIWALGRLAFQFSL